MEQMLAMLAGPVAAAAAAAALMAAAAHDWTARRIPNALVATVALAALPGLVLGGSAATTLLLAGATLLAGAWAFRRGLVGGGDVKLASALMLWAGASGLARLSLWVAVATLLLVSLMLLVFAIRHRSPGAVGGPAPTLPMGVPLAVGGIGVLAGRAGILPFGAG